MLLPSSVCRLRYMHDVIHQELSYWVRVYPLATSYPYTLIFTHNDLW